MSLQKFPLTTVVDPHRICLDRSNLRKSVFSEETDIFQIINDIRQFREVKKVTPNYKLDFLAEPNDRYYSNDWWVPEWWDPGWPDPDLPLRRTL